ncbi:hypothetical protein EDD22DRAFT_35278 [Suillus occidentalis]|nr:hypothetical protein EDD22DRAFT_35278 [Suillus occidentalis]
MHRLHNARSIAIDALSCRKRAFGVSTAVLNDTSDTDSSRTQGQSHIVDLGKDDDSRNGKTVIEQGQRDGHGLGHDYMPGKLSRSLRRRRDPSHAKSSYTATEHIDAKTTSSSSNLDSLVREITQPFKNPLLRESTQRSKHPLEGIIDVCARNSHHVVPATGASKRRKKEKHPRGEKAKALGKAKTGGAGTRPVVESARASLAKLDAERAGTLQLLMASRGNNPLLSNDATLGWGEDVLRPGNDESTIHSLNKMLGKSKTRLDPPAAYTPSPTLYPPRGRVSSTTRGI